MSTSEHVVGYVPLWTLGNRLWRARQYRGFTQQELAHELGIGLRAVKEAEADKRAPRRAIVLGWAFVCGVDPAWLEQGKVPNTRPPTAADSDCYAARYAAA